MVALVLAVVAALATPLMGLPDEPAHTVHAVAVVRGEVAGADSVRTDAATGWTRTETTVEVPAAYAALPELPTCFAFRAEASATCAPPVSDDAGPPTAAVTTVGTYAPPWYALVGWPSLVLDPASALVAMRVAAAVLFAAMLAVAAVAIRRVGAGAWGLLGLAAAVPPVAVHLAGGINPSGTEVAAAVALWATSAALVVGAPSRADVVRWVVTGVAVAVIRPLGPALAIGIPVVTLLVLGGRPRELAVRTPALRWGAGAVAAALVASLGWSAWRGTLSAFSGFPAPELGVAEVVRRSLGLVPERLVEMVGVVGWSDVGLHPILVLAWLVVVAGVVVAALGAAGSAGRWWLVALGVGVLVLPILADLRSAAQIGFVWQGRYTLPIAAGLPVLGGVLMGRSPEASARWRPAVAVAAGVLAAVHAGFLLQAAERFAVGTSGSLLTAVGQDAVGGVPYGVLLAVAGLALVVAVVGVATAERGGPARGVTGEVAGRR